MAKEKPLAPDKKTDYFWVDSRKLIEEEGYNEREEWGDIPGLAADILANGVQQALIVNKRVDVFAVRSGHRRRRACKLLEEQGHAPIMVPVILERRGNSSEERVLHLITDNSGLAFTPWEQAKVMRRLRNFKWSDKEIAERSGRSIVYVRRLLSLADAPQRLINLVREGRVSATLAMDKIAEGKAEELIEVGEKPAPQQNQNDLGDLFNSPAAAPAPVASKITKSDIQKPNSVKIFRKFVPMVQEDQLPPEKLAILDMFKKFVAGELTLEDFQNYFS